VRPLLKSMEAAALLNISTRTLWTLRKAGRIPYVRIGRCVRYAPDDLESWIVKHKRGGGG